MLKLKTLALCGASVAFMTIGATAVIADPAAGDPYTQNPTPQERQQTQQLNNDASDSAAQTGMQAQTENDNQAQYQQQQDQYQKDRQHYASQRARYLDERADFNFDRTHPETWWHDRYDHATLNRFYDVPSAELVDLHVSGENGYNVGRIVDVARRDDGKIARVRIELRDGERAWVDAHDLRYDPDDRIVFTDLSATAIYDMAANS